MDWRRIVLVLIVVSAVLLGGCTAGGCGTPVPDVKGKTPAQAEEALVAAGFKAGKVTWDATAAGAAGAVVGQDPAAGAPSSRGAIVNLTVAGAAPTTVPSLVGLSKEAAQSALAGAGLTMGGVTESFSPAAAAGVIIAQAPAAGFAVPANSSVVVVMSKGKETVEPPPPPAATKVKVPAVKGLKLAAAQGKLAAVGLKWDHVLGPGDGMTDVGFVYKQTPAAGVLVDTGSTVVLTTWKGP
jgi:hypothetical protein